MIDSSFYLIIQSLGFYKYKPNSNDILGTSVFTARIIIYEDYGFEVNFQYNHSIIKHIVLLICTKKDVKYIIIINDGIENIFEYNGTDNIYNYLYSIILINSTNIINY